MKKRILLKLSGEMLSLPGQFGVNFTTVQQTAINLAAFHTKDIELALVMGGGNIFRGINLKSSDLPRSPLDQMGMLATMINGVALKTALEALGVKTRLISALDCPKVADSYQYDRVQEFIKNKELIIFVGGTGNPYFTTDTCAALRACEIGADLLIKATKVDGVYDRDPYNPGSDQEKPKKFLTLTGADFVKKKLKVMDLSAVGLCTKEHIPIFVMNMGEIGPQSIDDLINNHQGTLIKG